MDPASHDQHAQTADGPWVNPPAMAIYAADQLSAAIIAIIMKGRLCLWVESDPLSGLGLPPAQFF